MVQATHFRKWHVPFPAIFHLQYHFQNGADHNFNYDYSVLLYLDLVESIDFYQPVFAP